jgi:hypothetical protein
MLSIACPTIAVQSDEQDERFSSGILMETGDGICGRLSYSAFDKAGFFGPY